MKILVATALLLFAARPFLPAATVIAGAGTNQSAQGRVPFRVSAPYASAFEVAWRLGVPVVVENGLAPVSPVHDVINGPLVLDPALGGIARTMQ